MKLVIDMNLSPDSMVALRDAGQDAAHWSDVGWVNASDEEILRWARGQDRMVLTGDLDFGTMLAPSGAPAPSVVQLRTGSTLPSRIAARIARILHEAVSDLSSGALVTVANDRVRVRPLVFTAKL